VTELVVSCDMSCEPAAVPAALPAAEDRVNHTSSEEKSEFLEVLRGIPGTFNRSTPYGRDRVMNPFVKFKI
jgi:hypothetical protein